MWDWLYLISPPKNFDRQTICLWKYWDKIHLPVSTWFFLPQQYENGECKLNLVSHDKNCVWLPRYRRWFHLPTGSFYPTLCYFWTSFCLMLIAHSKTKSSWYTVKVQKFMEFLYALQRMAPPYTCSWTLPRTQLCSSHFLTAECLWITWNLPFAFQTSSHLQQCSFD